MCPEPSFQGETVKPNTKSPPGTSCYVPIFIWQLLSMTLPGKTVVVLLMGEETGMEAATVIQPAAAALGPGLVRRRRWRRHFATAKVLVKGLHDVAVLQRTRHPGQGVTALNTAVTLSTRVTRKVFTFEFFAKTDFFRANFFLSFREKS
jgi:hypothetical protein